MTTVCMTCLLKTTVSGKFVHADKNLSKQIEHNEFPNAATKREDLSLDAKNVDDNAAGISKVLSTIFICNQSAVSAIIIHSITLSGKDFLIIILITLEISAVYQEHPSFVISV